MNHTSFLLKSERYFLASIVDSSQDSIVSIDFDNIITSWNKAAEKLYGYPTDEAIGKPLSMVVLPEDMEQLFKNIDIIKHKGVVEIYETVRQHQDGHHMFLEIMLSPVKNEIGRVIGVSTIARNITHRKIAEAALNKSEKRFKGIVNQASVGIFETDLNARFTLVNSRVCALLGVSEAEILGKSIFDFSLGDDADFQRQLFHEIITSNKRFESEKRLVHREGFIVWVNESMTAIFDESGRALSTIGILLDITERKRLEQQKDDFLAIASHEIKTPLTALKAYGQVLEDKIQGTECNGAESLVAKLNKQAEKLSQLVSHLLDSSRVARGSLVMNRQALDLDSIITEAIEQFKLTSLNHELVFQKGSVENVFADKILISEVINNLIANAIKYSPEGGKVEIVTKKNEAYVEVFVIDEGVGIPESSIDNVFDRFFRASHGTRQHISGLGLGLYISAGIIRSHGGDIRVTSKVNEGSRFSFTLPLCVQP